MSELNLITAETALIAKAKALLALSPNLPGRVEAMPANPEGQPFTDSTAEVWVRYANSSYETPQLNEEAILSQQRTPSLFLVIRSRNLSTSKGQNGLYEYLERLRTGFAGWTMPGFHEGVGFFYLVEDGFIEEKGGVWQYGLTFALKVDEGFAAAAPSDDGVAPDSVASIQGAMHTVIETGIASMTAPTYNFSYSAANVRDPASWVRGKPQVNFSWISGSPSAAQVVGATTTNSILRIESIMPYVVGVKPSAIAAAGQRDIFRLMRSLREQLREAGMETITEPSFSQQPRLNASRPITAITSFTLTWRDI